MITTQAKHVTCLVLKLKLKLSDLLLFNIFQCKAQFRCVWQESS